MIVAPLRGCHLSKRVPKTVIRSFFASSTDHTDLLSNAIIHRIGDDAYGKRSYVLIPHGTDLDLALKVDKLQLARIFADRNYIYGAKVVQRTLGSQTKVCKSLLELALEDSKSQGESPIALASLDGLSKWVTNSAEGAAHMKQLENMDQTVYEACKAIATGVPRPGHSVVGQGTYRDGETGWTDLASNYVKFKQSEEALLYGDNGGKFVDIDHLADTSRENMMGAGGAIARFTFDL